MTKKLLLQKIKALGLITKKERNEIVCALIKHSRIVETCFGYVYCGRCHAQIGDGLGSVYDMRDKVIIGHDCKICKENWEKMTWQDKLYVPNPFKKKKVPKKEKL